MRRLGEVFWRLVYDGGVVVEEPSEGGSIVEAWSLAERLEIVTPPNRVITAIDLEGGFFRPIFYRVRSKSAKAKANAGGHLDIGGGLSVSFGATELAATVFGRGQLCEPEVVSMDANNATCEQRVDGTLWTIVNGQVVNCPQGFIDLAQVRRQLEAELATRRVMVS